MLRTLIFKAMLALAFIFPFTTMAQITPETNFIGVDITLAENLHYDVCFAKAKDLGMSRVGIYQNWTALETVPGKYDMTIIDIANSYYPSHKMSVDLTVTPIHTNKLEVPADLLTIPLDNPLCINRFKRLLDSIKVHAPNLTLSSLVIGSEHDVYLGTDVKRWSEFTTFYSGVSNYARNLWPGLKVATELTFNGLTTKNTLAQTLNANSDYIGISYYPLNIDFTVKPVAAIASDFATLVSLYPAKPLCFYQYGFPSGAKCNSSEEMQARFIAQTFTSWDRYASNVQMIDFTWLHDLDAAQVNYYGTYYGITNTAFLEYLRTLGLRTQNGNGTDKAAFKELQCQANKRGFNPLNTICQTVNGIEAFQTHFIQTSPNPAKELLTIEMPFYSENSIVKMYDETGRLVKTIFCKQENSLNVATTDMPAGLYYLTAENGAKIWSSKFIIEK